MSSLLSAEIAATCSALGYFDGQQNKYFADTNTLETVKDLIRYLRRDNENHDIRRELGDMKVLQTDLIPLLKNYHEEDDLFDVLLRLVMNLTTPPLLLWEFELPKEKTTRNFYLQVEDHLKLYKEAFSDEGVWAVLSTRLSMLLEMDNTERGEENGVKIERILILIRNILFVPADAMERRPDNDASVHDQVVWALQKSGMLDIILYMTSTPTEQAYYMHILEITYYMLREQQPSELASAALVRSQAEKIRDEAELLAIRHKETNEKQKKSKVHSGTRHSRFGGTFVVKSMKSISDNELIYHKPLNKLESLNFDADKKKPKTPKNRMPIVRSSSERRSAFTIRLILKEFCVEFLYGAYNAMMLYVKSNLVRAGGESHDESVYFWAVKFFMAFNRHHKFEVKLVSETMSVQIFHYIQQRSEHNFDLMQTDKKKLLLWSERLHKALLAYCELFNTLFAMDKSPDGSVRDASKVIKSNIFYVPEYREFILTLLINYDELKMSNVYLKDLIETQHIFLKMFESFYKQEGSLMVRKKVKGKKKKSKKPKEKPQVETNLERQWDEASPQLSAVLESGQLPSCAVPFDAASEVPIDEQKADAMKKIQSKLREGDFEDAIGLMRAAREVWPENDSFGSSNITPEEEFLALREIYFAELGNELVVAVEQDSEEDSESDEEEEEEGQRYAETDFKFEDFMKRLPHPKIVKACALALRSFETNSISTNHCILKLLHRIAFDCKMYIMVFQLSIFRTFQKIFAAKELPQYKELVKFATYIMRQFFQLAKTNELIFVEAVFWKSHREAYEIETGYATYGEKPSTAHKAWSELEEDELRRLFMEHQENQTEDDVVDWIVGNLIDNTKSRRQVLKKLKEMYLLTDYKAKKKSGGNVKAPQNWGAQEETQLRELYEEFKDAMDPLGCILPRLEMSRPKNRVVDKMLVMGLIQDKKELRKKRVRSGKAGGKSNKSQGSGSSSDTGLDSDHSSSAAAAFAPAAKKNTVKNTKKKPSKRKKRPISVRADRAELVKLLLDNMEAQQEEALDWLKDSISDAIEDYEDGTGEGIPLVPIMDYATEAMENDKFKSLLKALGISEPFDEQEAYWRIPGDLPVVTLKSYCDLLQEALDNNLTVPEDASEPCLNGTAQGDSDASEEDYLENLRKKKDRERLDENGSKDVAEEKVKSKGVRRRIAQNVDSNSEEEELTNKDSVGEVDEREDTALEKNKNIRKGILDDSDDEPANENEDSIEINEPSTSNVGRRNRSILESDSEEEESLQERGRSVSNSDSEKPAMKSSRINDEPANENAELTDANEPSTSNTCRKKMSILESDSEEEESLQKRGRSVSNSDSEKPAVKRSRVIESDDE
ncbi:hypothetical protein JTB14_034534 [Gonioctena quinquepunctata]|nr:hypothetical protein JTB14_034534 [Gonioctena quinquepunctata]